MGELNQSDWKEFLGRRSSCFECCCSDFSAL